MPQATPATCTTRPTSTTGRSDQTSLASMTFLTRPRVHGSRATGAEGAGHAIAEVVPEHLAEVRDRRSAWIDKARAAVKDRLTKEISYWDHRAEQLKLQEQAGKPNARLNSDEARRRADDLQARLQKRLEELELEAQISPLPPVVLGGLLVVPAGTHRSDDRPTIARRSAAGGYPGLGCTGARHRDGGRARPRLRSHRPRVREARLRHREPGARTGRLRFLEVKGRVTGAATITVTKNEILYSLNKPDDFILAIVEFLDGRRIVFTTCADPSSASRISG